MKVAGVGFTCIDVYHKLNRYYATGNGVDFAINLSKFNVETSIVSAVGDDEYGSLMFDTLKKYGVDTSHLHVEKGVEMPTGQNQTRIWQEAAVDGVRQ